MITTRLRSICVLAFAILAFLLAANASAQTLLVDTGAPTSVASGTSLNAKGNQNCSPKPSCSQSFQFWAGQFTLTHAATIDSVQVWMGAIFTGGQIKVNIYADGGNVPGNSIFAQTYTLASNGVDGWVNFPFASPNPSLAGGTYWLAVEPVAWTGATGSGLSTNMDGKAPSPLARYAVWNESSFLNQYNNGYRPFKPGLFSFGMRVSGTSFADLSFGTAGRAAMAGSTFGLPFNDDFTSGGVGLASVYQGAGEIPSGFSILRANVNQNGLSTGTWSAASICFIPFYNCTTASGFGRAVAFRTFTNLSNLSVTVSLNAILHGGFSNSGGSNASAVGHIYVLDSTQFSNIVGAAPDAARFLVNSNAPGQDLGPLFGTAVLGSSSQTLTGPVNTALAVPLTTGLVVIGPSQSVTVMFDVTTITPAGNSADFFSSLDPAANLFTDQGGNPVPQLVALGPATPPVSQSASLVLSPATASTPLGTTHTVTATVTDSNSSFVPGAAVYFAVTSGPNAGNPAVPFVTDANGQATFTYADATGAGTDTIQAQIGTLQSNIVQKIWTTPGPLDHIVIGPATTTIAPGASQPYTAQGFDVFKNSLGDVTAATTFSISPDGSCTGSNCTASVLGPHTITGNDGGKTAQASLTVNAGQTTPTITWVAPAAITYGTALSATQLNATASVAGTFAYNPASGTVLGAGSQSLALTFTPTDTTNYTTATASVTLMVNKATPVITWATPAAITYGAALSVTQLNATANVAGTFVYTAASGTVPIAGSQTLSVSFTPTDTTNYTTASASVTLVVNTATSVLTWATPAPISYGTPLSATQLNATANVAGTFVYTPASGTLLNAGSQTLSVVFTPADSTNFTTATASVTLVVNKVTPIITWAAPTAITYGTPLSATQLNATANVAGAFVYTPASGTVPIAGSDTLAVTFTPTDTTNYTTATASVTLVVNKAAPVITWATPTAISFGTALSATQLNATASVTGTFVYTPASGAVLNAGSQALSVNFTPTDTTNYAAAAAHVTLVVNKATPAITWATPAPITLGTALSATQLNATANVTGTFVYNPATGTVLPVGTSTLNVTFTPSDTTDYTGATASVTLLVNSTGKTTPVITWLAPAPITYGTPLSRAQLNATANVPGTYAYSPTAATILTAGLQTLTLTFTPANTTAYTNATASVIMLVNQAKPFVFWLPVPIIYGTQLGPLQLDAVALAPETFNYLPGTFAYTPPAGTVPEAGDAKLSATFTPNDAVNYETVTVQATLEVFKASPKITWAKPAPIVAGTPLSATQLNAIANVPGTFAYTPPAGTVLRSGTYDLKVKFTPADSSNYQASQGEVDLTVKSH